MGNYIGVIAILLFFGMAYLLSNNKKEIHWRTIALAFFIQIIVAFSLLHTNIGTMMLSYATNAVSWVVSNAKAGIEFVFGELATQNGFVFFLSGLLPIVFISALMGVLFHFGVIQWFVRVVGLLIAKLFNVDVLVSVNAVTNIFLGQTDALTVTKSYLPGANDNAIFATVVGGMTSISVSTMGIYVSFGAKMEYILLSMLLNVFSTLILTQMVRPTTYVNANEMKIESDRGVNVLDTLMSYAMTGFKIVIGVTVALIAFIGITTMLNGLLGGIFPFLTIEKLLGIIFFPLALVMGIPMSEVSIVSELLATKFFVNEAVAFGKYSTVLDDLSERTQAMVTFALCGFAAISSIGIMIGGYSAIAPNKKEYVARIGFLALIVATISNLFTASLVGLLL